MVRRANEEILHGIPSARRLKEGDIVGLDLGVVLDGYYGDSALTAPVGKISGEAERLLGVAKEALELAIGEAHLGNRVGDISAAVQGFVEKNGFSVVREFVGHGIGRALHEEPQVPNYGRRGHGAQLKEGMVLALETDRMLRTRRSAWRLVSSSRLRHTAVRGTARLTGGSRTACRRRVSRDGSGRR